MPAQRPLEDGIVRDFKVNLSYGEYLHLDEILEAQHPVSRPAHHDELLFILQHQTSELWLKLVIHELRAVQQYLAKDELRPALKGLARVKHIQRTLTEQWSVLATLTPTEYAEFRSFLGTSSGFQSYQYRAIEFLLGNKDRRMLTIFDEQPAARALLEDALATPSVYDEFLHFLARRGHDVPVEILQRDVTEPWDYRSDLVAVFRRIYENADQNWDVYEACEELVDLEENFQLWRFRHLKTVERTIGVKRGTGGSSGVSFLKAALDLTFFPELYAVRTEIGVPR
ncbi:tryptophan 2,3-dioxygenase [Actinoplanes lutulentus]|uniref:Tryptophan 2,3-dioxygenase n=1 Tax=Actinoplanes lutulentus TaxID=1287878 RepID=A0A327ZFE9_9ACTN|nr:tryptophan 2,3-dioxygenase family protein [Actinoplanes lutulentus]MBB2942624.1 tryptophan 2,3-dioxygenase [Actinoplanes lutulentus]RAK38205.1 tryptophan 2,3-dioxygenase [Actinoplanes lutulentus]